MYIKKKNEEILQFGYIPKEQTLIFVKFIITSTFNSFTNLGKGVTANRPFWYQCSKRTCFGLYRRDILKNCDNEILLT